MEDLFSSSSSFSATYEEVLVALPAGVSVRVRESNFHVHNANRVWPGTAVLAAWLAANPQAWRGKRMIELGAATGILAIFLTKIVRDPAWTRANGAIVDENGGDLHAHLNGVNAHVNARVNVRENARENGEDLQAPLNGVNARENANVHANAHGNGEAGGDFHAHGNRVNARANGEDLHAHADRVNAHADGVNAHANARADGEDLLANGANNAVALDEALVPGDVLVPGEALQLTTSDYADDEIADAIAYNFALNALADATPPHWPHTWGTPLPADLPRFQVVIANDILIYVKQYPNLVATLLALLRHAATPDACVILSCQRRIGQAERDFLDMLEAAGARYTVVGPKIYRIDLA